ncbi:hypothetical protein Leryth_008730 [Lithospermum erythrorhizon]|nr:hypothetical protein Leryth_008730 [Lithospermum erythrorhizon]
MKMGCSVFGLLFYNNGKKMKKKTIKLCILQ